MPQFRDEAGNIWEVDAQGNPVFVSSPGGGAMTFGTPDPNIEARANNEKIRLQLAQQQAAMQQQLQELEIQKRKQELAEGSTGGTQGTKIDQAAAKRAALEALTTQLNQVESQFLQNFTGEGDRGLGEYLPTPTNKQFDAAAAGLSEQALGAFRTPGVGAQSDYEAKAFADANKPSTWEYDAVNQQRLNNIRNRLDEARKAMGMGVSQRPDPTALEQRNPFDQDSFSGGGAASGGGLAGAITGNTGFRTVTDQKLADEAFSMYRAGKSLDEINALIQQRYPGAQPIIPNAETLEYSRKNPNWNPFSATRQVPMSRRESATGSAPAAALAGALNMGSFGGVQALAPEKYAAISAANPGLTMGGEIAGAIAGTQGIGMLGREVAKGLGQAPRLLGGGSAAQFARNMAADMTYGAGYGGVTQGDPVTGAAYAAGGSALGQGVGSTLGRAVGGLSQSAPAQYLASRGVTLTTGQRLGGLAKDLEDKAMSVPIVGNMIRNRRVDAFNDFNRAAINEAGAPIGATTQNVGMQGVQDILDATGTAYDNATAGVTVPLDDQFTQGLNAARARVQQLPPDLAARGNAAFSNRIDPIATGSTGPVYSLPMPSQLNKPLPPTPQQVAQLSRMENVPLSQARAGQSRMAWKDQNEGRFAEPLVDGYGDAPLAVRMENGEYIIYDGNHRAVRALNAGNDKLGARVIDARSIDPANAGRKPSANTMDIDELLRELGGEAAFPAPTPQPIGAAPRQFPAMTGDTYQQAVRGLKGYKAELTKPGFEADYRDVLQQGIDVLTDQMKRGGGERVVQGLNKANSAYRQAKTLQKAVEAAKNGTGSGDIQVFTPAQLNTASYQAAKKFPGPRPFAQLADAGQQVLPSTVPDSGTAGRLAQYAMPAALGGTGYAASQGSETAQGGLGLAAVLALLATKRGQKTAADLLFERNPTLKKVGTLIGKKKGLFGSALVPLALEAQQ